MARAQTIGVIGAGTMGSGIAQLAARSGARTLLHDPLEEALAKGLERARAGLQKEAQKGKLSESQASEAAARIEIVDSLEQLAPCELVIEAAPERIELKRPAVRRPRGDRRRAVCAREQHLLAAHHRDRGGGAASRSGWWGCTSSTPPR